MVLATWNIITTVYSRCLISPCSYCFDKNSYYKQTTDQSNRFYNIIAGYSTSLIHILIKEMKLIQAFSLGVQEFLCQTTAKLNWKKEDKFQTSLWTRLVPLISKWTLKVLHREMSNRFNVAPCLTFQDFQSYIIIISTMSTIYEVIHSQNWSLIFCQWFFWSQYSSLSCKVLPQHRNQQTVSVTKLNWVLRK